MLDIMITYDYQHLKMTTREKIMARSSRVRKQTRKPK